ncbi:dihydroxyacetone kinase subunit L [Listeria welshimeri]|uniref:dihydroxyacetone kinase subunit DhaL n=1 Tax=Listeria welshimeri TaxID=1643 RepID=UPI0010B905C7|nr:dihydroxyacetone kinase subunit DhaL [Listeria welshimeri]MBC1282261.1 dihydroxyacetone kinase subunit L [Listeria welshimeri]MBC1454254.1 dihydroxyacetone kinase subunit L [Listeria welshimeri]MBC1465418.1 dihydroxyacetone kinase subunit L [Listeria welshimeri]MBC1476127.1 dihydroxyacetone kinase subunit L [Listeria welshimeri]MBC1632718.1 dihydroxyacetone kinase subunit L [Listeria welshimeri]
MVTVNCEFMKNWISAWTEDLLNNTDYLNELDTPIGDDDHGTNMERGAIAVREVLTQEFDNPQELTKKIAMALLTKVGGASGVIYGTAFLEMSKETELSSMINAGLSGIVKRGKAEAGDKTLLDVWIPVSDFIKQKSLMDEQIQDAVEATKPMLAKKGRAEFVGEQSIGHIDPGSVSSGYLFKALAKEVNK